MTDILGIGEPLIEMVRRPNQPVDRVLFDQAGSRNTLTAAVRAARKGPTASLSASKGLPEDAIAVAANLHMQIAKH